MVILPPSEADRRVDLRLKIGVPNPPPEAERGRSFGFRLGSLLTDSMNDLRIWTKTCEGGGVWGEVRVAADRRVEKGEGGVVVTFPRPAARALAGARPISELGHLNPQLV